MQFKLSTQPQRKEGFFNDLCTFLETDTFKPLIPDRFYYLQTALIQQSSNTQKDSEPSESSEYVQIQPKEPIPAISKFIGGFGIKLNIQTALNINSQRNSSKSSAGSLATVRTQKQNKIDKYAPVMSQITDFMYLSGIIPASDPQMLKDNKITYILNLCGDCMMKPCDPNINNLILLLKDAAWENITNIFYNAFCFIQDARSKNENILIHCYQGVSRSASVVIAYLMFINDMTYEESYAHTRVRRPVVSPNTGFIYQLCNWWRDRHSCFTKQQKCLQQKFKYQIQNIVDLQTAIEKDSAIRDIQGSHFVKCEMTSRVSTQPVVFRFSVLQKSQKLYLLKKTETKLVNSNKQYIFDPRFIYLVTDLSIGTCLIIGSQYNKYIKNNRIKDKEPSLIDLQVYFNAINIQDSSRSEIINVENIECQDLFQEEDPDLVLKFQASPIKLNDFLITQGNYFAASQIYSTLNPLPLPQQLKKNLINRIVELEFFEKISPQIMVFSQNFIESELERYKNSQQVTSNFSKISYLLGKLQMAPEVQIENDWMELPSEKREIQEIQQLMRQNPSQVEWKLQQLPKVQQYEKIKIFETQQEFDQDMVNLEDKILLEEELCNQNQDPSVVRLQDIK
ncbi:Dual specificity phosphatase [Spironucleus salmonicida]|uniref:Dual specificity phosphatase n=1 Tax=Spironucleus salmonicida TaxID=348837 RepID=V6LVH8_9EUKA|nr:Dual specificity phosphatase [Spironucleus salmonicida]|eukprot:EST48600.1 Dual specificity phosphatase [Spironucleus salmonicida]